jgi:hypothetical protein
MVAGFSLSNFLGNKMHFVVVEAEDITVLFRVLMFL